MCFAVSISLSFLSQEAWQRAMITQKALSIISKIDVFVKKLITQAMSETQLRFLSSPTDQTQSLSLKIWSEPLDD